MILFHILSVPLFGLLLSFLEFNKDVPWKELGRDVLKGMFVFLPAFILFLIFRSFINYAYRPFFLYLYLLLFDHLLYFIVMTGGLVIVQGPERIRKSGFLQICLFCAGYYTLVSLQYIIVSPSYYSVYSLVLLPLLRMATIVVFAVLMTNVAFSYGWQRALYVLGLVAIPFITNVVTFLYETHRPLVGMAVTAAILLLAATIWRYLKE